VKWDQDLMERAAKCPIGSKAGEALLNASMIVSTEEAYRAALQSALNMSETELDAAVAALDNNRETVPEAPDSKREVTIFSCGGSKCSKGGEHEWDGEWVTWDDPEGGGGGSTTCSKCGMTSMHYDLMNAP